jgi:hypothetical protein
VDDTDILKRIDVLEEEAHRLERQHGDLGLTDEQRRRLAELQVEIDRNWDLLRQRRARRRAGEDPNGAMERPAQVVEGYSQ